MSRFPNIGYEPLHPITMPGDVEDLLEAAREGKWITPILVSGNVMLTGTHRAAALERQRAEGDAEWLHIRILDVQDVEHRDARAIIDALLEDEYAHSEDWQHQIDENEHICQILRDEAYG